MDQALHQTIGEVKSALESRGLRINRIFLFGPRAEKTPIENSDINLLIISNDFGRMNLRERMEFIGSTLARLKTAEPINVLAYTELEFKAQPRGSFIGNEVKSKGIEVK